MKPFLNDDINCIESAQMTVNSLTEDATPNRVSGVRQELQRVTDRVKPDETTNLKLDIMWAQYRYNHDVMQFKMQADGYVGYLRRTYDLRKAAY